MEGISKKEKPKYYADAAKNQGNEYYDYEHYEIKYGNIEQYEIIKKIGRGKYSEVYKGIDTKSNKFVVLKILKPVKKSKIRREIKILQELKDGPNIIRILDVVKDPASKMPCIVTEWIDNDDFNEAMKNFTEYDIKFYLYQILVGLNYCHSKGIMHRDIKPHNIVFNKSKKILKIIDWGLAEYYIPDQEYNVRVSSKYYKGPELLVDDCYYDYSLDIWSVGCIMAGLLCKSEPFFKSAADQDQLDKIASILGTEELKNYINKYDLNYDNISSYDK